ncbi:MAG TPA: response regulator [Gemmatimonadaceae bacterium]|nr:response regulator [Gemmatimonadaceae bacterium]
MPATPVAMNEDERLKALDRYGVLDTPRESSFDEITSLAASACDAPIAVVNFVTRDRQWSKSCFGVASADAPRAHSFCAHTIGQHDVLIVADTTADPRFADNPMVTGDPHVRFYAGAPLITSDGLAIGSLCVCDRVTRTLSRQQIISLEVLARQVMSQLELRYTVAELKRQIARRATTENFLRDSEDRYRSVLSTMDAGVVLQLADGLIWACNASAERILGTPASKLMGQTSIDARGRPRREDGSPLPPEEFPSAVALRTSRPSSDVVLELERADGTTVWISVNARPMVRVGETRPHAVLTTLHDITGLRAAQRSAEEAEERFRRLSDAAKEGIAISEKGIVVEVNRAFCALFGYDEHEVIGRSATDFINLGHVEAARRAINANEEGTYETVGLRKDGTTFDVEVSAKQLPGHAGVRRVAAIRDISDRKAVDRLKNEFVSTVSHELRTPLTSIRGSLGLIEGGVAGDVPERVRELVRIARTNADRLIRLINDILDLEKMEAGKLELRQTQVDPQTLVDVTLAEMRGMADSLNIRLERIVTGPASLTADADRLQQVLTNLLSNAIKFSPSGATVYVRALEVRPGVARIEVEDAGPGIAANLVDRLFRKFEQLDGSDGRARGGTGLGLAISRSIVEQHGGRMGVHSEPGVRTVFWFELGCANLRPNVDLWAGDENRHVVLVVEDDEDCADTLAIFLTKEGYRTAFAASLAEARTFLDAIQPSAILLDLTLPDGDGMELLSTLRAGEAMSHVPVVILSEQRPDGMSPLPTTAWLRKPHDETALLAALRQAVRRPGSPKALIVDDDTDSRAVLRERLRALGVETIEAADGFDALQAARAEEPDLIVLDVAMPNVDGFELVATLRREKARTTPLVVYTGRDLSRDERHALTLGITRHLTKARSTEAEFVRVVRELLGGLITTSA